MDWMWEYYTYMSRADEAAKKFAEDVEEMAVAARDAAEHLAALMRELGALAYAKAEKCFRKVVSMRQDPYCEAMLGWCELQKGNCRSARHRLQSAIEQGFDEDWVRAALEQCQLQENS